MRSIPGTITDPAMDRLIFAEDPTDVHLLDDYQEKAASTAIYPRVYTEDQVREMLYVAHELWTLAEPPYDRDEAVEYLLDSRETEFSRLVYPVLGLLGEAGEIAEKVKKIARDGRGQMNVEQHEDLSKEIGDQLWYASAIANELGYPLSRVASENIKKLFSRKARGARGVLGGSGDNR